VRKAHVRRHICSAKGDRDEVVQRRVACLDQLTADPQSQLSRWKIASRSIGSRFVFLSLSARRRFGLRKTLAGSWS
jgi:hypothetical protein